jgi:hypothetical protein
MNEIRRFSLITAVCLTLCFACSDDGDEVDDLQNPAVTIDNVTLFQALSGTFDVQVTATDDVGVDYVDLLVDGELAASGVEAPFTISWDTTAGASGVVSIAARVTDGAGKTAETEPIQVVVTNGGEESALTEGNDAELSIPADFDGTQEVHVKHHWTTSANGAMRVIALMQWEVPAEQDMWQIKIDIGTGFCPHSGTTYATSDIIDTSPMIFDATPDDSFPASTQLFVHMQTANPYDHLGESLPFSIRVFTFE